MSVLMSLILRNEMRRGDLIVERWSTALKVRRKWSDTGKTSAVGLEGLRPEQQTRSNVCPLVWVGKSMRGCSPKLSRQDAKSLVRGRLVLSMCILKSPSTIKLGDRVDI